MNPVDYPFATACITLYLAVTILSAIVLVTTKFLPEDNAKNIRSEGIQIVCKD